MDFIFSNIGSASVYFLSMAFPLIAVRVAMRAGAKKTGTRLSVFREFLVFAFCFFLAGVFAVTGLPSIFDLRFDATAAYLNAQSNISWHSLQTRYNIIMFIPFGLFLPILWKKYENPLRLFAAALLFTVSIETAQLFNLRLTDVDDVVLNVLGALIGYVVFIIPYLIIRLFLKKKSFGKEREVKRELSIYMIIGWMSAAILHPLIWGIIQKIMW